MHSWNNTKPSDILFLLATTVRNRTSFQVLLEVNRILRIFSDFDKHVGLNGEVKIIVFSGKVLFEFMIRKS